MARFTAAASKGQQAAMNTERNKSTSRFDGYSEDPFALTENCDYPLPSKTVDPCTITADEKPVADDDDIAIPTPIATLVFTDGRTEPVYKPLAGHEHLFKQQPMSSAQTCFSSRASNHHRLLQPAPTHVPGTAGRPVPEPQQTATLKKQPVPRKQKKPAAHKQGLLKSKSLKRTRSVAQGLASGRKVKANSDDADEDEQTVQVVTEESYTFYIGDIDEFKHFLCRRFDELTMKPLRGIVTHWVRLLEPKRLGDWGKYHEMLPSEADTPPWWPRTVIYKEPSHLKKSDLSTLAVEMMLVHRKIDEIKRKGSWISKLRDVAKFTVRTTSADHFSNSKGAIHSEQMKKRALEQILPSIFDVAQTYEDHIMQYSLFEGSGNVDPGRGKHHTWKLIPRPARRAPPKRPRRAIGNSLDMVQGTIQETSDETDTDDTMARLAGLPLAAPSPRPLTAQSQSEALTPHQPTKIEDGRRQTWRAETPTSSAGPCTPMNSQDDCNMYRTASTPSSSFDQPMHGLHLREEDLDTKPAVGAVPHHGTMQPEYNMVAYNQPGQHPTAQADFGGQSYQPTNDYVDPVSCSFAQAGSGFINPFSIFNAQPPHGYTQYASPMPPANNRFPYDQNVFPSTPMSFPSTPINMSMAPAATHASYHGLPSDYCVDGGGLHRF